MAEKSKEVQWNELTLDQKKLFDIAMAKELNQVATSRALRNITKDAHLEGRWKRKGAIGHFGFQAHNLCEAETTSPTLSKVGRNLLLAVCAACGLKSWALEMSHRHFCRPMRAWSQKSSMSGRRLNFHPILEGTHLIQELYVFFELFMA